MLKPVRRRIPALGVLGVGLILSAIFYSNVASREENDAKAGFNAVAQERFQDIRTNITLTLNDLDSMGDYYDCSHAVDRNEFTGFAKRLLRQNKALQAIDWIPRVPRRRRQAYEKTAAREGFPEFQITERAGASPLVRAAERAEYFPVFYLEPFQTNERSLGFDLGSDAIRREALERARDTGRMAATSRVTLVEDTADEYAIRVFRPVYREGVEPPDKESRRAALRGLVSGVLHAPDMVEPPDIPASTAAGLEIVAFDRDAKSGSRLLFPKGARFDDVTDLPNGFRATTRIAVAETLS